MFYYNFITKEYPRHIGDLKLLGWQEGQNLPTGWVLVKNIEIPETTTNQIAKMIEPVLIDNVWTAQFQILNKTEAEIKKQEELTEQLLVESNRLNIL